MAAPSAVENVPARQSWQVPDEMAAGTPEYKPALQRVHAALADMPVPVWYAPAWQSWQATDVVAPLAVEYSPAPQDVHEALAFRPVPVK